MTADLWRLDATAVVEGIRTRRFSAREVVAACLGRIETTNPQINALTEIRPDAALAAAAAADRMLTEGTIPGPLHGVPVTIKGNVDLAGWATVNGCAALRDSVAQATAPAVGRWLAAGAIVLGRSNTPEFCCRWDTDNEVFGRTRNPWHPGRTPGGSSGGAAASLAVGMAPLAHGNDLGGSLRQPAQACGIASIKPGLGRVPTFNATDAAELGIGGQLMWTEGAMARSVRDVRLALGVMAGADPRDPWAQPVGMTEAAGPARGRIALVVDPARGGVSAQVAEGVRRAGQLLAAAGYEVESIEPPGIEAAAAIWRTVCLGELLTRLEPAVRDICGPALRRTLANYRAVAPPLTLEAYAGALADRRRVLRDWLQFLERYPLVVGPVGTEPPLPPDADNESVESTNDTIHSFRFTVAVNALGLPSAVVPVGTGAGMPQVVQIIGAPFAELRCLAAAEAIEAAAAPLTPIEPRPG